MDHRDVIYLNNSNYPNSGIAGEAQILHRHPKGPLHFKIDTALEMNFTFSLCLVAFCISYTNQNLTDFYSNTSESVFNKTLFEDSCPPTNTLSSGNAFWVVFVLAVACVVQLPGSIYLFDRSTFYRFSPELGLVDALATAALIIKALHGGYRWAESVVAV